MGKFKNIYIQTMILSVFVFLFTIAYAGAVQASSTGTVTGSVVNIRSGPGTNYEIVGSVYQDTQIEVLGKQGTWYQVQLNAAKGWIAESLLNVMEPIRLSVAETLVNLRSGPSTTYNVLGQLKKGDTLNLLENQGDWYKVQTTGGTVAYIAASLVSRQDNTTPTAPITPTTPTVPTPKVPVQTNKPGTAPTVILNGQQLSFEVPPIIENSRTLVPLRAIFEAMGAGVSWNEATRTVTSFRGGTTVILPLGSTQPTVNASAWQLDVPAKIVNNRTLAPLRFVGEAFGGQVGWNEATRVITITTSPTKLPAEIQTKQTQTILRDNPAETANQVDTASAGERFTVLAERNGWYQVSGDAKRGWIAGWLVNISWETQTPKPPVVVIPDPPAFEKDEIGLSRTRDEAGIKVTMELGAAIKPQVDEKSGTIIYRYRDMKVKGLNYFTEGLGSSQLKVKATQDGEDAIITLELPSSTRYRIYTEDQGKKQVFSIPNYILSVETKDFAGFGERIILTTVCPVTYTSSAHEDKVEVKFENLLRGNASSEYRINSDFISAFTFSDGDVEKPATILTINAKSLGKHAFGTNLDGTALNVIVLGEIEEKVRENLVVLDPGHGGKDTGARGTQINEKDVNLTIALKVGELLKAKGIHVVYTRDTDMTVSMEDRAKIANDLNAAIFVSIHNNSTTSSTPSGTETFFYAPLENPALFLQKDERCKLATLIQNQLQSKLQRINRGVKENNLSVLRNTTMPSALAEISFLSNATEQALLMQDSYRQLAAEAIANGIETYMKSR